MYLTVKANVMASGNSKDTYSLLLLLCHRKKKKKSRTIEVSPMRNHSGLEESVYYTSFRKGMMVF